MNTDSHTKGQKENSHFKQSGKKIIITRVRGLVAQLVISRSRHREENMVLVRDWLIKDVMALYRCLFQLSKIKSAFYICRRVG